jgi:hypothetical protein
METDGTREPGTIVLDATKTSMLIGALLNMPTDLFTTADRAAHRELLAELEELEDTDFAQITV